METLGEDGFYFTPEMIDHVVEVEKSVEALRHLFGDTPEINHAVGHLKWLRSIFEGKDLELGTLCGPAAFAIH
jgi:hypothetical protein